MHREYLSWPSPSLGRSMEMLVFGHAGTPILAFPSSMGRFFEWEDFGMVGALGPRLEAGHNRLFLVDSVDRESFYNKHVDPYVRIVRYRQYERYVVDEVLPMVRSRSQSGFVIAAGASFGAYHASNFVFKHPRQFGKLIAMSGAFDIRSFMNGFYNEDVYFNNPVDFLPNLEDHDALEAIRANHIILTMGDGDPCLEANRRLSGILHAKSIPHTVDVTPGFGHDWPWWREVIARHVA